MPEKQMIMTHTTSPLHEADLSKFVEVVASNDLKKTER